MNKLNFQELIEKGFSVIPVNGKKPLIEWKSFQTKKADVSEVEHWCQNPKLTGVAVVTGQISGIAVLDIDSTDIDIGALNLPNTPQVKTSRGYHFYFKCPEEGIKSSNGFRPKMDLKADGGYIISPPSKHPDGHIYEWLVSFDDAELADLPSWVIKEANENKLDKKTTLNGVAEGGRNDAATVVAGSLLSKYKVEDWGKALKELKEWNYKNMPPLPEVELESVFRSISDRELASRVVSGEAVTETTKEEEKVDLIEEPLRLQDVLHYTRKLGISDDVVTLVLAVYVSVFLEKINPIWMLIVGVPGSNKTTALNLLRHCENIKRLDTMTDNPFTSGQKEKDKPKDLLPELDGKCFIVKDYTTIFGRREDSVRQLLSDLVSIYDGEYAKHSPCRGTKTYYSTFSHLGAITSAGLAKRQTYMSMVGARFLQYRVPLISDAERKAAMLKTWTTNIKEDVEIADLHASSYANQLIGKVEDFQFSPGEDDILYVNKLAELTAKARGIADSRSSKFTNDEGETVRYYEIEDFQVEEPFRALHQLRKLLKAYMLVRGVNIVGVPEKRFLRDVVLSSMPVRRAEALQAFVTSPSMTVKAVEKETGKPNRTIRRHLEELVALGVLRAHKDENDLAKTYTVVDEFVDVICTKREGNQLGWEEIVDAK